MWPILSDLLLRPACQLAIFDTFTVHKKISAQTTLLKIGFFIMICWLLATEIEYTQHIDNFIFVSFFHKNIEDLRIHENYKTDILVDEGAVFRCLIFSLYCPGCAET